MNGATLAPRPAPAVPAKLPRVHRERRGAWVGGVCVGVARHLSWSVVLVRIMFVLLAGQMLVALALYGALWILLPRDAPPPAARVRSARPRDVIITVAVTLFGVGLLSVIHLSGTGWSQTTFIPIALGCLGIALVWRQADLPQSADVGEATVRSLLGGGWMAVVRVIAGVVLVVAAVAMTAANQLGPSVVPMALAITSIGVAGVALVSAPWLMSLRRNLNAAREEKIMADARADMAAHLHDSVLQTLALIQRQSHDGRAVASLARRQERELRAWLYGDQEEDVTFRATITEAANDIEDAFGIRVELVVVGDCALDRDAEALVMAAREAMTNAAKHSGAPMVDVYAEADDTQMAIYVRDRGIGFEADSVAEDRLGIKRSILDRLERHGGRAEIRSNPGEGTEVRLEMGR